MKLNPKIKHKQLPWPISCMHLLKYLHRLQQVVILNYASGMTALDPRGHWLIGIRSNPKLMGLAVGEGMNGAISTSRRGTLVETGATVVAMATVHLVGSSNDGNQVAKGVRHKV